MAVEMTVSTLSSRGGKYNRGETPRREMHFIFTSQSHTHKTLIDVENELISEMFSLICHCTFERGNYFDTVKQARINSITATCYVLFSRSSI